MICVAKYIDKFHKIATIDNMGDFLCDILNGKKSVFALESVRDPGNLGTIIRSAVAFGVDCILLSSDCAEIYNPKTIRAAMGTLFRQNIVIIDDMPSAIRTISQSGRRTYAAALSSNASVLGKKQIRFEDCIVIGNEGHGISSELMSACDEVIFIPMTPDAESLNAAIASSICLWEQFGRNL